MHFHSFEKLRTWLQVGGLGLLLVLCLTAAQAQTYQKTHAARLVMITQSGEKHFTSQAIYANLFLDQKVFSFRSKAGTFLETPGITQADADAFTTLFNLSGNPEIELAGKLPDAFVIKDGEKPRKVEVTGYLKVGGIKRNLNFSITLAQRGEKIEYSVDQMVDGRAWGLTVPIKYDTKPTGTFRFILNN